MDYFLVKVEGGVAVSRLEACLSSWVESQYEMSLLNFLVASLSQMVAIRWFNIYSLRPRQDGRCFADNTCKRIFFNENVIILIKISLKFVPKGPINEIPALVQMMAWCRLGEKPLSEPMMVRLPMYMCHSASIS